MKATAKRPGKRKSRIWRLSDANMNLAEVVEEAAKHGPQVIQRRGVEAAVVLSFEDYVRLAKRQGSLVEFLAGSPLAGSELELERSKDPGRAVDL